MLEGEREVKEERIAHPEYGCAKIQAAEVNFTGRRGIPQADPGAARVGQSTDPGSD
jgi:hypothetical protein